MKRIFTIIILTYVFCFFTQAQQVHYDTLSGHCNRYYYSEWYDSCASFIHNNGDHYLIASLLADSIIVAKSEYTDRRMPIKGLTAMVAIRAEDIGYSIIPCATNIRLPEYLMLYKYNEETNTMTTLATVRWDTAAPKILKLPKMQNADSAGYMYCYAFEAMFKSPVYVDSTFYIGGTINHYSMQYFPEQNMYLYPTIPPIYCGVRNIPLEPNSDPECSPQQNVRWKNYLEWIEDIPLAFGYFLAIVDNHELNVTSGNDTMGTVSGQGLFPDKTFDTIRAIPHIGYVFSHWNDGNTENPRIVYLTQDTSFIAYFVDTIYYTVSLNTTGYNCGSVDGAGAYPTGSEVTITAIADNSCNFEQWTDGDWHNPRTFILTQDTLFTAEFSQVGIAPNAYNYPLTMKISPNPVHDKLSVNLPQEETYMVEIYDTKGRCMLKKELTGNDLQIDVTSLLTGFYILKIQSTTAKFTQAFVKK